MSSAIGGFLGGPWGMLAAALGPGLIGSLLPHDNPRKLRQQALGQFDPRLLSIQQQDIFQRTLGSSGYGMARSDIMGAGQTAQNAIGRQLGQTGLGRTGVGLGALGAAAAAPGIHLGRLTASAWDNAAMQAQNLAQQRAAAIMGMPQQRSLGGPMTSAGLAALIPLLMKLMAQQGGNVQHTTNPGTDRYGNAAGMPDTWFGD